MQEKAVNKSKQRVLLFFFTRKEAGKWGKSRTFACMKRWITILAVCLSLLDACQQQVEIPLQIPYAETAAEMQADGRYALYLLSEVEDTIPFMPDSIRMRFRLAQAMGLNASGTPRESLLPPLLAWFDEKGPAEECARVHHLQALSLLRRGDTEGAQQELARALEAEPTYVPSRFISGYICLYEKDYAQALEHFTRIRGYRKGWAGITSQIAWASIKNLQADGSEIAEALQSEEMETARKMLLDMDFAFTYFREHPDEEDKLDIIYRCAHLRDSLLQAQSAYGTDLPLSLSRGRTEDSSLSQQPRWFLAIPSILLLLILLYFLFRRRKPSVTEPRAVFVESVQRMEQLADMGKEPTAEEWESLRRFVQSRHPAFLKRLKQLDLSRSELQMCLLSIVNLRQKQVATLLGISPQNLRNQRLRLLARVGKGPGESVQEFIQWIEKLKTDED